MFRYIRSDSSLPSGEKVETTARLYGQLFFSWPQLKGTILSKNKSLHDVIDSGHTILMAEHSSWKTIVPFLYVTRLGLSVVQGAADHQQKHCLGEALLEAVLADNDLQPGDAEADTDVESVARAEIVDLVAFFARLDREVATMPLGFIYSVADEQVVPIVGRFCGGPSSNGAKQRQNLSDALNKAAGDRFKISLTDEAKKSGVPVDQQHEDALLIIAVLQSKRALAVRVKKAILEGAKKESGRILIEKHDCGKIRADWQPLTKELREELTLDNNHNPSDKTLEWMLAVDQRDRFVVTVRDGFGPHAVSRTSCLHSMILQSLPAELQETDKHGEANEGKHKNCQCAVH